jgi:hypothetical protein
MKREMITRMSVAEAVELSIGSTRTKHLVTISDAALTVRSLAPHCEHTDRELADVIALLAVRSGCDVFFDSHQSADKWPVEENRPAEWPVKRARTALREDA